MGLGKSVVGNDIGQRFVKSLAWPWQIEFCDMTYERVQSESWHTKVSRFSSALFGESVTPNVD